MLTKRKLKILFFAGSLIGTLWGSLSSLAQSPSPSPAAAPSPSGPVLKAPGQTVVGIISAESRADFEARVAPFFKEQWRGCDSCLLKNISPYDDKGNFDEKSLAGAVEAAVPGISFLFFNVNWKFKSDEQKALLEILKKINAQGVLIVGSAGYPKDGESSAPLSRTLLSQIPEAIVVGEMNDRERLLGSSYYGPEMLTAIKPPRDWIGKGLGPSLFAAKLAQNYSRRLPKDWVSYLRTQKSRSRKIWPQVEEFFSR